MATILVVDDLSANRKFLVTLLRHHGHRLVEATNGVEGLASVQAEHPDLVITDVLMPVMDGYEFVRQLRLDPANNEVPVVFYSAHYGEREARELALSSGLAAVLTKPAESAEVLKIVRRALDRGPDKVFEPSAFPLSTDFDREHLRLLTNKLSDKAEDLRTVNCRLRALINIVLELASERDSDLMLQNVCVAARDLFGATYATLGILGVDEQTVQRCFSCGADIPCGPDAPNWTTTEEFLAGILGAVIRERRTLRGGATHDDPARQLPFSYPESDAFLVAPIASPTQVYGWLCLVFNERRTFTEEDEHLVLALSGQVGRIYENDHLYALAQKHAEELEREMRERKTAEVALRNSERLNRHLVEHLPHRILVKDRNSVTLFCNANYAQDLGLPLEQVIGKDAFAFYPRELAEAYSADDRWVMAQGTLKEVEEPYQANGQARWVHTVKVPYRNDQGEIIGVLVVFEDITERKQLEGQFRQSQKMEAMGRLAGGVAHDFNNLLTVILGNSELLLADLAPDDPHQSDIAEIQKAGERAAGLTRQLLAFSRKQIIEPTLFDLNVVVADMLKMLGRLIGEDVKVVLATRSEPSLVEADRGQMEQVVMNLAVNARDAMPKGGTLTIATGIATLDEHDARTQLSVKPGDYVVLTVTDTGTGIAPEVQARLFEPFFTTKEVGKGTGLGLATVHGIVTGGGGGIRVSSEVGKGTSFKVYFPRAKATKISAEPPPRVARPREGAETVLVVEDADALRELARRMLQRHGYTVLVASNAEDALSVFEQNASIDVLLTDVVMPGTSGPELSRQLVERRPDLRVIYMSGYTEDAIVHHGVLNPGITLLHKPFTSEALGLKIREVLDR
ncbi:MAG: response regulator [Gemmatimonadota bacterium]|nr:response regulator [Gemmatimonadota bacterium]